MKRLESYQTFGDATTFGKHNKTYEALDELGAKFLSTSRIILQVVIIALTMLSVMSLIS